MAQLCPFQMKSEINDVLSKIDEIEISIGNAIRLCREAQEFQKMEEQKMIVNACKDKLSEIEEDISVIVERLPRFNPEDF